MSHKREERDSVSAVVIEPPQGKRAISIAGEIAGARSEPCGVYFDAWPMLSQTVTASTKQHTR